jgi:DNA (cytosine-5)-methyltransferase 1
MKGYLELNKVNSKFKLLDLFCCAGGTGYGYFLAGFDVTGIDNKYQKNYPFTFILSDAFEYLENNYKNFDAIHASPPCQKYSKSTKQWRVLGKDYPDLIEKCRKMLIKTGKPYIIENVPGSPLINPIILNGSVFGLLVHRKRLFECNFFVKQPEIPKTKTPIKMGRPGKDGDIIQPVGHFSGIEYAKKQMEIDWMIGKEMSQAIPPIYTKYIGKFLKDEIEKRNKTQ